MTQLDPHDTDAMNRLFARAGKAQVDGDLDQAEQDYRILLEYFPDAHILLYNLGLVCYGKADFSEAAGLFEKAGQLQPDDPDVFFNLALCRHQEGDLEAAIEAAERCRDLTPESCDLLYNLSCYYRDARLDEAAIEVCNTLLAIDCDHLRGLENLAYIYHRQDRIDKAMEYYSRVLALEPEHPAAGHMLAALSGENRAGSPDAYVRDVFDSYSHRYEKSLVEELEYRVPEMLKQLVLDAGFGDICFAYGLDLGCGTGLGAEPFAPMVRRIDGVDLSPRMIEKAAEKKIYTDLQVLSIECFLERITGPVDFILAADVFAYLGDLEATFKLTAQRAAEGGLFCFSTETVDSGPGGEGYRLRKTGRFGHRKSYVEEQLEKYGWTVRAVREVGLRRERGEWITGNLWLAVKEIG